MKQILLRVTGADAEMLRREPVQPLHLDLSPWKVKLAQRFHYPDIHRESGLKAVSKQQNAIGNFPADTGQFHQLFASDFDGQVVQTRQIELSTNEQAGRFQ